jgi:predicted RNA binding protein YcfA (HicA-like mRNA interferase family)
MPFTSKELIRLVEKDGWFLKRVNGSHCIFRHPHKTGMVVIPNHGSSDVPKGTYKNVLKQAGLSE